MGHATMFLGEQWVLGAEDAFCGELPSARTGFLTRGIRHVGESVRRPRGCSCSTVRRHLQCLRARFNRTIPGAFTFGQTTNLKARVCVGQVGAERESGFVVMLHSQTQVCACRSYPAARVFHTGV